MKKYLSVLLLLISVILIGTSCKKYTSYPNPKYPVVTRVVRFILYSDHDLSGDNHNIVFNPFIENTDNKSLFDSTFASMKIKDIPDAAHKIVFEKTVPANETGKLKVGFRYAIENVGNSWFIDSVNVGQSLKIMEVDFR